MSLGAPSRRGFLKASMMGGAALVAGRFGHRALAAAPTAAPGAPAAPATAPAALLPPATQPATGTAGKVALTAGNDRADLAFQGLRTFEKQIAAAIGNKRIILKPNMVGINSRLCASDPKNIEGILEFLKSIKKIDQVILAESTSGGSALTGFANYGIDQVAAKYNVKMMDLDTDEFEIMACINQTDPMRPQPVRVSKMLLDQNSFIISAAKFKTHNAAVATLSLKNIVMAAPLKLGGGGGGRRNQPTGGRFGAAFGGGGGGGRGRGGGFGGGSDKPAMHGGGAYGMNYNLASFATRLHPHLAVIDGYEGMEGDGPMSGTPVDHRVCVVSMDWLAADRVGVELMGIDFGDIGYLNYAAQLGLGQADLTKIEVLGEKIENHVKKYRLSPSIQQQLQWKQPLRVG